MLIDINAYIGHWPFRRLRRNTPEGQLERMNATGVEKAVLFNLNGIFYKNTQSANDELFEELDKKRAYRQRFIPFATINPIYSGWKNDFRVSTEQLGFKGIRLHPTYHGYELHNPACVELVRMAAEKDLPVALSLRIVDSRPSSWLDISKEWALKDVMPILRAVPEARYLILNVANSSHLNVYNKDEMTLFRNSKVLMDTSGRNTNDLGDLLKMYGNEKFAFGSHSPVLDHVTGLLRIESLRPSEASDAVKEQLRSGNAKKFLKL